MQIFFYFQMSTLATSWLVLSSSSSRVFSLFGEVWTLSLLREIYRWHQIHIINIFLST